MASRSELKVYRASWPSIWPAWPVAAIFFVIGVGGLTFGAHQSYPVMNVVTGALTLLFSMWTAAMLATNRLIVIPAGLVYWNNVRRRFIGWADVQSFAVGRSRTVMRWPGLAIHRSDGSVLVTNIVAFTAKYPARIADELATWQRQLATDSRVSGDLTQGESSSSAPSSQ